MTLPFKAKFYGLVGFQLLLLIGLIGYKQFTLLTGECILLQTVPVDPREMFRGDYVALRYHISQLDQLTWQDSAYKKGDRVYVALRRQGRFWEAESVSKSPPKEGVLFLRGRVSQAAVDKISMEYGIESYFVPEGKGSELERQAGHGLTVDAAVDRHGRAVIRGVHAEPRATRR